MSVEEIEKNLDHQYLGKLENISFRPIFILGLNRSGTSILYKMLSSTQCFNPVTVYHLVSYNQLVYNHIHKKEEDAKRELTIFFKEQGQMDRGIDRLKVTADFAEEYGFLLGQKTFMKKISPKNLPIFVEMAKKIQFISDKDKPLLLKNPLDFPNFIYIKKVFPEAKFIFVHRNPLKVISSTIKALRVLFKDKSPLPSNIFEYYYKTFDNPLLLWAIKCSLSNVFPLGMIVITMYTAKSVKYYLKNITRLSKEDYIYITYENLCGEPQKNIEDIMNFLNMEPNKKIDFKSFIKPRKTHLDKSVLRMQNFIFKSMRDYFNYFRYQLEK